MPETFGAMARRHEAEVRAALKRMGKPDAALVQVVLDREWPESGDRGVAVVATIGPERVYALFAHLAMRYRRRNHEKTDPDDPRPALNYDSEAIGDPP